MNITILTFLLNVHILLNVLLLNVNDNSPRREKLFTRASPYLISFRLFVIYAAIT